MTTQQYIDNLNKRFQTGISREQAYHGDLQSDYKVTSIFLLILAIFRLKKYKLKTN